MVRVSLKEMLEAMDVSDQDILSEEASLLGNNKQLTPRMIEIMRILQEQPLLCQPCLAWLQQKQSQIAESTLAVLYSPEELQRMKEEVESG